MQVLSADDWPQLLYRLCIPLSQALSQLLQLGAPAAPWLGRGCVLRDAAQDPPLLDQQRRMWKRGDRA
jgi:hypothetical protein